MATLKDQMMYTSQKEKRYMFKSPKGWSQLNLSPDKAVKGKAIMTVCTDVLFCCLTVSRHLKLVLKPEEK